MRYPRRALSGSANLGGGGCSNSGDGGGRGSSGGGSFSSNSVHGRIRVHVVGVAAVVAATTRVAIDAAVCGVYRYIVFSIQLSTQIHLMGNSSMLKEPGSSSVKPVTTVYNSYMFA